ncbi:hypothetical protein [Roseivirga misakiensis]|uniref:Uncharacterized protein n=1 Tax=Roseivirga misakiensis TaxID=1563681 RepID=A0A1E5SKV3_9BACT|nr:hypothetical protein [Roseivirga misakiensis]OEJ99754.1 hypothetical protein BFP71_09305 [Roseivirga misakiensis]
MGWSAIHIKQQIQENKPKKAFAKARSVYGDRMEDTPFRRSVKRNVTTDFDELLRLRKENARRKQKASARFIFLIGIGMAIFLISFLIMTLERFS